MATTYNINTTGLQASFGYSGRFENTMAIYGTFNGCTISAEVSYDGTTYIPLPDLAKDAISTGSDAIFTFKIAGPVNMRFNVTSGSEGSPNVKVTIG